MHVKDGTPKNNKKGTEMDSRNVTVVQCPPPKKNFQCITGCVQNEEEKETMVISSDFCKVSTQCPSMIETLKDVRLQ